MSQAFKCDRCGNFFEKGTKDTYVTGITRYDLCASCQVALDDFLHKKTFSPDEVQAKVTMYGQNDRHIFAGEQIKYTPSQICNILRENLVETTDT